MARPVEWREIEVESGQVETVPVLRNPEEGAVASIAFDIPLERDGKAVLVPGEPYLISVLCRPAELAPGSFYFVRWHEDWAAAGTEIVNERRRSETTYLHQQGFLRVGKYGVEVPRGLRHGLRLEFGLSGPGELALWDARFASRMLPAHALGSEI